MNSGLEVLGLGESCARERFEHIARQTEVQIDLAEAALLVAAEDAPPVAIDAELARLDALAREAAGAIRLAREADERLAALNHFLFTQKRFAGNSLDFYDPRNSYLNEVLERRVGIPISLAIVYIAVAGRLGLDVHGVSFPGHFLVKLVGEHEIVVDPFSGKILDQAACRERLGEMSGPGEAFRPEHHLRSASKREILVRLLSNLKFIWLRRGDFMRALPCADRILALLPDAPGELRDRGLIYERLGCRDAAVADFERFLSLAPTDASAPAVSERIQSLRAQPLRLH